LGDDPSIKVKYIRTSKVVKSEGGTFVESINTTTYTVKITINNKHQFPIQDLTVQDVIPHTDDKRIKVILLKPEGLGNTKDGQTLSLKEEGLTVRWQDVVDGLGGEKEGKFEWKWKVSAASQITLESQWKVEAPVDMTLVEGPSF
jgi:hypothetical protein